MIIYKATDLVVGKELQYCPDLLVCRLIRTRMDLYHSKNFSKPVEERNLKRMTDGKKESTGRNPSRRRSWQSTRNH